MCLAVYIASNRPLPLIDWDEQRRGFNVVPLTEREQGVKKQFRFPFVAYVGTHLHCGCGFLKKGQDEADVAAAQANYHALAAYLGALKQQGTNVELFSCWEGDQEAVPVCREKVSLEEIVSPVLEFKERAYYVLT